MKENCTYLYHYYPLNEIGNLTSIQNIEMETINSLLEKNKTKENEEPFRSLYRATLPITEGKIWINRLESLNDPFEFRIYFTPEFVTSDQQYNLMSSVTKNPMPKNDWKAHFFNLAKSNDGVVPYNIFKEKNKNYGIYSFTQDPNSICMWSYYANSHAGICVRFKIHKKLEQIVSSSKQSIEYIKYNEGPGFMFGCVSYHKKPLIISDEAYSSYEEWHLQQPKQKIDNKDLTLWDRIISMGMTSKHEAWAHEKECRLIALGLNDTVCFRQLRYPNTEDILLEVDAIILGLNTHPIAERILRNSFNVSLLKIRQKHGTYELIHEPI